MSVSVKTSHKNLTCQNKFASQPNQAALITVTHTWTGPSVDSVLVITVPGTQSEWTQAIQTVAVAAELNGCLMVRISVLLVRLQLLTSTLNFAMHTIVATYNLE